MLVSLLLKKVLSASSYGHFTAAKEFRSQCHIFRFGNIGFLRSLIFDDVFYTFLERPSPRNADFPSRGVFTDPQGGATGEPGGSQGGATGDFRESSEPVPEGFGEVCICISIYIRAYRSIYISYIYYIMLFSI